MALLDNLLGKGFLRNTIGTVSGKLNDLGYTRRDYIIRDVRHDNLYSLKWFLSDMK